MTATPGSHLSTLTLHQLRYGELDGPQQHAAEEHLAACEQCRQRHQGQLEFRRTFEVKAPRLVLPEPAGPGLWEQLQGWLKWTPVPVLAMAAAALVFVNLPQEQDTERTKGLDELVVVVQGRGVLDEAELIRPGDRIQIRVPAGPWDEAWIGDGDALIGSFDLAPEQPTISPFALDVDGEPGDEELVIVLSQEPLGEDGAAAAMSGRRMDGVEVRRLTLHKGD